MASIKDAIAEAMATPTEDETEGTAEAEAQVEPEVAQEGNDDTTVAHEEQSAEGTTADDEVPVEYFGVDLSDLPPDARRAVIDGYTERDKFIQQLLRDKSQEDSTSEATPDEALVAAEGDGEVSDADILQALGIDPENDPFGEHVAKAALPLAKMVLSLNEQVEAMAQRNQVSETERYWTTSLDALQKQYGALPPDITFDDIIAGAAKAGIAEPMDAYWRIMGPGRQAVFAEVEKRRAELTKSLKQGAKSVTRPSDTADSSSKLIIDEKDVGKATKVAMEALFKERGISALDLD